MSDMEGRQVSAGRRVSVAIRLAVPVAALLTVAAWLAIAPEGALGKLDAVGYAVCHRIEARSFHVDGRQLPMCARCTGEFNAAAIALLFQFFAGGKRARFPSRGMSFALAALVLAFAIDGTNSFVYLLNQTSGGLAPIATLYGPNNTLRLFTGTGMGLVLATVLYPAVNQTLWRDVDWRRAMGWKSFGILLSIVAVVDLMILTEHPAILYPAAVLSVFGVLALLTLIFAMLWITIMRADNTFTQVRRLWLPACAGLTLGLLLVLGLDLLRYQLTGTWGGFPGLGAA